MSRHRDTDAGGRQPCADRDSDWSHTTEAKECLGPPEAERGKERPSPEVLEGLSSCQHLDFQLLASRTVRK